jgi:DNA-binding NtrC family response regulator
MKISRNAMDAIKKYSWPGNIRELQHTLEKAVILCNSETIEPDDLQLYSAAYDAYQRPKSLEEMERLMIIAAIKTKASNMSAAADELGITRQTLYNKLKKYGL